jgi:predicted aspartyl protease
VGGLQIHATVDTAADITVISARVFDSMIPKSHVVSESSIRLAGEGTSMNVQFLGDVGININGCEFVHPIYVGPLQDEMLLGTDFLSAHDAQISCNTGILQMTGFSKRVEMISEARPSAASVVSARRVRIPPHTAQVEERNVSTDMPSFIIEPTNFPSGIIASRIYSAVGNVGKLCVMNMTDRSNIIKDRQYHRASYGSSCCG